MKTFLDSPKIELSSAIWIGLSSWVDIFTIVKIYCRIDFRTMMETKADEEEKHSIVIIP